MWLQHGLRGAAFQETFESVTTCGFAKLSGGTVPRVPKLCSFRTARSSRRLLGQAEGCCNVNAFNTPHHDGFHLAASVACAAARGGA